MVVACPAEFIEPVATVDGGRVLRGRVVTDVGVGTGTGAVCAERARGYATGCCAGYGGGHGEEGVGVCGGGLLVEKKEEEQGGEERKT